MLPKIETPTFDFNIPSTGEVKKFRPFLVKEEKVLMLASEGGEYKDMISACEQVVSNCSLEEIDVSKLAVFDLVKYYLKDERKERMTIAGATVENPLSSSLTGNIGFPDHIKRILDMYKIYS